MKIKKLRDARFEKYGNKFDDFPERLREAFDGENNAQIARMLSVTDTSIKNYMEGRLPAADILVQIADLTKCSIHWLLTGEGTKHIVKTESIVPHFSQTEIDIIQNLADQNGHEFGEEIREMVLKILIDKKLISDQIGEPMTLEIFSRSELVTINLLGEISAGEPLHYFEHTELIKIIPTFDLDNSDVFALRVRGDSMEEDDICDGDIVICIRSFTALNGDRVVAVIDGDKSTIKRYYRDNGKVRLQPSNKKYNAILVDPDRVEIHGIVKSIQKSVRRKS